MITASDREHLRRCLELAEGGLPGAHPNPLVGARLVDSDEAVVAEGVHRKAGEAHAEVDLLRTLSGEALEQVASCTLYVNLEPCSHHGKTPPCVDAILAAGVGRVVCCHRDPNEAARGGAERLRAAGVQVEFLDPLNLDDADLLEEAVLANARFLWPFVGDRSESSRPLVTLKWAMSLDGKIATRTGDSQWISSPQGRDWALGLRGIHDAILVGSGTALADDPRLTRRGIARTATVGEIARVVMDRRLRLSPSAALFDSPGDVFVFCETEAVVDEGAERKVALERAGAEVVVLEKVTPITVCAKLATLGMDSILVEGGGEVLGAFLDEGVVDLVAVCCAPVIIGGAESLTPIQGLGVEHLRDAVRLERSKVKKFGDDVVLEGVEKRCLQALLSSVAES